jgi:hypothetical protein
MAKAKMKQVVVPKFSSEAEEAAWWDANRSGVEAEIRRRMKQRKPLTLSTLPQRSEPSQPVTQAHSQGRLGNGTPIGRTQGHGVPDLYQDAAARSAGGKCGWEVEYF